MAIFLDTCFYYALISKKDQNHQASVRILKKIQEKMFGTAYTSDFILNEACTLINVRTSGDRPDLVEKLYRLFVSDEPIATMVKIEIIWQEEIFHLLHQMTKTGNPVSFTDASNVFACKYLGIDKIVSFDEHFRGFLQLIE